MYRVFIHEMLAIWVNIGGIKIDLNFAVRGKEAQVRCGRTAQVDDLKETTVFRIRRWSAVTIMSPPLAMLLAWL